MAPSRCAAWLALLAIVLAGCDRPPQPPDPEEPPEPQAAHAELRHSVQAPLERARSVQAAVDGAGTARRAAVEAQGD